MRVVTAIALLAQVLFLASPISCADKNLPLAVPAPDELAPIGADLRARVHAHELALQEDGLAKTRAALERTLAEIASEYGEKSVAVPQSITEAGLMIMSDGGTYAEALPYMARAVDASIAVYGPEHRETAFVVHDYAYAQILASPGKYVPEATPLLERALAIRRRVLGAEAPETAGSERSLADQLVKKCRSQSSCTPEDPLLEQAAHLAEHALGVIRTSLGDDHHETAELERAVDEIARARGKPVLARSTEPKKTASPSSTCGRAKAPDKVDDLSWVRTNAAVYRLTPDMEFSVGGFDGRPWKLIAKHELEHETLPGMSLSPGQRWIAYSGGVPDDNTRELWLFDTRTRTERRVAITPKFHTSELEFSPDGATLAYFAIYDERWTRAQGMGLYLVDTQTGRNTFAGYPSDTKIGPLLGFGSIFWAADGSSVLLHLVGHPKDEFTREFHRFDLITRSFRRIDGNYDKTYPNSEEFRESGQELAQHKNSYPKSHAWFSELKSPSGAIFAHVDEEHRLLVRHTNGADELVDIGGYSKCEGVTIGITGWVDGDKYLVYRNQSRQIIYDSSTGRRAVLFNLDDVANTFTW